MSLPRGLAIGLIVAGVLGIVLTITSTGSVRSFVKDKYDRTGSQNGAEVYRSTQSPTRVAAAIQGEHEPADRRVTPDGIFLRYRKDFVGIQPSGGGSRITLADERRGYGLFYPFVGGYWGRFSGPAESFRGGGPGGGGK